MKTFKDFIATRQKMSAKQFEQSSQVSIEDLANNVYVYMEHFYIDIHEPKNIGYASRGKKYGLVFCNEYHESDNLRELEVKLYNDWFIDCVEGNDEWMYEVGWFTPKQCALYMKMFRDMNLSVDDITHPNDIVDTLRLSWGNEPICDVLLPNSATQDLDNEKHDTFQLEYLDMNGERIDGDIAPNHIFETIDDLEDGLIEWFHQMARDYMMEMDDICGLGIDEPMSLDEFLIEYKDKLNSTFGECYKKGKRIEGLHNNFNTLPKHYKFVCEPKQAFDEDNCPFITLEKMNEVASRCEEDFVEKYKQEKKDDEIARLEQEEQDKANMSGEFEYMRS
jgi:hypothetical protein